MSIFPLANDGAIWIPMWILTEMNENISNIVKWVSNDRKKNYCLPLKDARELTYSLETW